MPLVVPRGVFCPTLTQTSKLLLDAIDFTRRRRVLDAFSGSGAFAVHAAVNGATVVAVDSDARAVVTARMNACRNHVSHAVEVRNASMSRGAVAGERFDLIIANPPLLPGTPNGVIGHALYDPAFSATYELLDVVRSTLTLDGDCYLLTSDVFDRVGPRLTDACESFGLVASLAGSRDCGYEVYRVHQVKRPTVGLHAEIPRFGSSVGRQGEASSGRLRV